MVDLPKYREKRDEYYIDNIFVYYLIIRESHLDTFGHLNNATYLQLFEEARWDYITNRGFGVWSTHSTLSSVPSWNTFQIGTGAPEHESEGLAGVSGQGPLPCSLLNIPKSIAPTPLFPSQSIKQISSIQGKT